MERLIDRLFNIARSYIAVLDGQESLSDKKQSTTNLSAKEPGQALLVLHETLQEAHPETGAPYWRIRCWGLACWQPIYLAMICVYQLKAVPLRLQEIEQKQSGEMVAGYFLPDGMWQEGSHKTLIKTASEQLNTMFQSFETAHVDAFGGRPALYQGLLADQLMSALIAINNLLPDEQKYNLETDFQLWAQGMNLPLKPLAGLSQQETETPVFVRHTCCLHFRRDGGELCTNCPRLHTKSAKQKQQNTINRQ
ncbi:siderophore ferric iron reductase [Marinomonas polaris]|uniref:siderophore ferric iron reductase n=1 Tax=Marinomonas polaris TaxID=293552 RepID=UPI003F9B6750